MSHMADGDTTDTSPGGGGSSGRRAEQSRGEGRRGEEERRVLVYRVDPLLWSRSVTVSGLCEIIYSRPPRVLKIFAIVEGYFGEASHVLFKTYNLFITTTT